MTIADKIQHIIVTLTPEELDTVIFDDVKDLSNKQIELYITHACQLKRNYFYALVVDDGSDAYIRRYGTFISWIEYDNREKKWVEMCGGGLIPAQYKQPPIMMTKKRFAIEVIKLNIPLGLIERVNTLPIES